MPSSTFTNVESTIASSLDFHIKSPAFAQTVQDKPLLNAMTKKQKTFAGGKGEITKSVKFNYSTTINGYEGDDTVSYVNPQNVKKASYGWKEIHAGITVTLTELKQAGISVSDTNGESFSKHSGRDAFVLTDLLQEKLDDMSEGWAQGMNAMLWKDGTQDAKQVPGLMSLIKPASSTALGTTGGISRVSNPLWRNRAASFTYASGSTAIIDGLRAEVRQLKRYGGKPNVIVCGSGFLEKLEKEIHSKGLFTQSGFTKGTDIAMGAPSILGIGEFVYDPTLDSLAKHDGTGNQSNFAYVLDTDAIQLMVMDGEDKKVHNPARPENKYAIYKGMTWTGGLVAWKLNSSGLYEAA